MATENFLLHCAKIAYRGLPIPRHWKKQYLAPIIFRLSGRLFRRSGAYQAWVIERNRPIFDRLADHYYKRRVNSSDSTSLDLSSAPNVSIIILSHNHSEFTLSCLQAALEHTDLPSIEIIILDNGSSFEESEILRKYSGPTRLMRSEDNLGFGRGCNYAVTLARGEHLVFLNNDVIVTKGWLTALFNPILTKPDAGIIGPKLIYADGTLQEAGADVLPDGHVAQRGKGDDPRLPRYNCVESVAYCSGAAMLVRRELFLAVGGFDEGYAPAYYEDVDLCYKIRQLGYRTYFCPEATVIHREGGTSSSLWGTDGVNALIERNRQRFLGKWGTELRTDT